MNIYEELEKEGVCYEEIELNLRKQGYQSDISNILSPILGYMIAGIILEIILNEIIKNLKGVKNEN